MYLYLYLYTYLHLYIHRYVKSSKLNLKNVNNNKIERKSQELEVDVEGGSLNIKQHPRKRSNSILSSFFQWGRKDGKDGVGKDGKNKESEKEQEEGVGSVLPEDNEDNVDMDEIRSPDHESTLTETIIPSLCISNTSNTATTSDDTATNNNVNITKSKSLFANASKRRASTAKAVVLNISNNTNTTTNTSTSTSCVKDISN